MLLDSKSNKPSWAQAQDKLSQIPTMVSEISRKISDYRQSYRDLVENAEVFFEEYPSDYKKLTVLRHKVKTYQEQIDFIDNHRKEKGSYPQIKGQPSAQRYLARLVAQQSSSDYELRELESRLQTESNARYEHLDHLTGQMLDLLNGERIFSQFLGTIALSTPSPKDKIRHVRNEKYKPIYVTALAIALFEQVRVSHGFNTPFLVETLKEIFPQDKQFSLMAVNSLTENSDEKAPLPMPAEMKLMYRESVLKPLAKAALLQSIGLHSPEVNNLLGQDRYRKLDHEERQELLSIIDRKTNAYLKLGIGIPTIRHNSKADRDAFVSQEKKQLAFILTTLNSLKIKGNEIGDLLRIPMTYASFLLSTKQDFDYKQIYQAYDILNKGKADKIYKAEHVDCFLKMVGRFPLGAGIYVIQQESGEIERAIVSSLYPSEPDEPVCKLITRRQLQFISQAEVVVSKESNLFFEESRRASHYEPDFFQARYKGKFTWNATDVWDNQVPAIQFWKKDGKRRYNGSFNPDSY